MLININQDNIQNNNKNGVIQIQKNTQHVDLKKELLQSIQRKKLVFMKVVTKPMNL